MSDSFTLALEAFEKKANSRIDLVIRKIVMDLFSRVIMRTPVRTGRARANWTVGVNAKPAASSSDKVKDAGPVTQNGMGPSATKDKMTLMINQVRSAKEYWLVNSVPYILRLEYGYSQQAPAGMVRVSIVEIQKAVRAAAKAVNNGA